MQEKELKKIANGIFSDFVSRGMTFKEAIKALRMADGMVRKVRVARIDELERTSIKEALKEASSYSSSIGNSAKT